MTEARAARRRLALSLGTASMLLLTTYTPASAGTRADDVFPVEDIRHLVENVRLTVESLDASESETRDDRTVTVTLTSDVLFAFDKWEVTGAARTRLARIAESIRTDAPDGVIEIAGHTDDQGSKAYNRRLSQRRAEAVRGVLAGLLSGRSVTLRASGHGETRPRVPNMVGNRPSAENRALNRRVEIVYEASR
ncbi:MULTISPECIES: OmpA family protein [Nonomuraea]|uniref:OmpA family protein n=1 Tax=Nonomuraea TaxID=83681 RepID=UPI001C60575E|nr:OmpA family protein [Nonomuraea ceibae]